MKDPERARAEKLPGRKPRGAVPTAVGVDELSLRFVPLLAAACVWRVVSFYVQGRALLLSMLFFSLSPQLINSLCHSSAKAQCYRTIRGEAPTLSEGCLMRWEVRSFLAQVLWTRPRRPTNVGAVFERQFLTRGRVPFVDFGHVSESLRAEILAAIADVVETGVFVNGPVVETFEREFAAYCGAEFCVGTASGLDALRLALLAVGIEPGDEVVVPAQTFIATWEAVTQAGGIPVPVDISESDYALDLDTGAHVVGPRTRFLVPVHLYGQLADKAAIEELARRHGLVVVEDACQAHGAARDGRRSGMYGDAAAFSFYPTKNLGAFGDAGAVVTNNEALADRVKALREHGQRRKYDHELPGYTARLDAVQAAVLVRKLPYLDEWNESRRAAARYYSESLAGIGDLRLPPTPPRSEPSWHLYVVRTADPTRLAEHLAAAGIASGRHYPTPPHLTAAYASLGFRRGEFPVAEALADEGLSLPIFPGMTEEQLESVVVAVREYFGG
jgi:dTDP-4-amino-4,6-dideoxygalactose transaminase